MKETVRVGLGRGGGQCRVRKSENGVHGLPRPPLLLMPHELSTQAKIVSTLLFASPTHIHSLRPHRLHHHHYCHHIRQRNVLIGLVSVPSREPLPDKQVPAWAVHIHSCTLLCTHPYCRAVARHPTARYRSVSADARPMHAARNSVPVNSASRPWTKRMGGGSAPRSEPAHAHKCMHTCTHKHKHYGDMGRERSGYGARERSGYGVCADSLRMHAAKVHAMQNS